MPFELQSQGFCPLVNVEVQWRLSRRECIQPNDTCTPMLCTGNATDIAVHWRVQENDVVSINETRLALGPECCDIGALWEVVERQPWSPWRYGDSQHALAPNCSLPSSTSQPRQRVRLLQRRCNSAVPECGRVACQGQEAANETEVQSDYVPPRDGLGWSNWTAGSWSPWHVEDSIICGESTVRRRSRHLERTCLNTGCAAPCEGNSIVTDEEEEVRRRLSAALSSYGRRAALRVYCLNVAGPKVCREAGGLLNSCCLFFLTILNVGPRRYGVLWS